MVLKPNLTIFFASFRWGSVSAEVSGPEENIGIRLTSGFHMEPEELTAASIAPPAAKYFRRLGFEARPSEHMRLCFDTPQRRFGSQNPRYLHRLRWPQSCKVQLRGGIWAQPDRGEEQEIFLSLC